MAEYYREGKIAWTPLVIFGSSFLRPLLGDMGYHIDEGIVLVADDETQARKFLSEYCRKTQGNGVEISSWKKRRKYPDNFCCGFLQMKKGTKEEEATEFLFANDFFPVVIGGGIIHDFLRYNHQIFRLSEKDTKDVSTIEFETKIANFRTYIVENVPDILQTLEGLHTSIVFMEYAGTEAQRQIFNCIVSVGAVYAKYLRKTCSEREVTAFADAYIKETLDRLQKISEFATGEEIPELMSSCVWNFLQMNEHIALADMEAVGGKAYKALKKKEIILFDDVFYYFPHELFVKICKPLLETRSCTELKEILDKVGILYCNSADKTVKKTVTTSYGAQERVRFLWVHKEFLFSPDNLRLEDVFCIEDEEDTYEL